MTQDSNTRHQIAIVALVLCLVANLAIFMGRMRRDSGDDLLGASNIEVLGLRQDLVTTLESESLVDSIDRLPSFDGSVWALGPVLSDDARDPLSYVQTRVYVPQLDRVKKIIDQARDTSELQDVSSALIAAFSAAISNFEVVYESKNNAIAESVEGITLAAPDDYWKKVVIAPATTYILAELNISSALPKMSEAFESRTILPVNRVFLFYAMHLLVKAYPEQALSSKARELRLVYLKQAQGIPEPKSILVSKWDADFDSTDPRARLLGRELPLGAAETSSMRLFPGELSKFESEDRVLRGNITALAKLIKSFVAAL
jgi:hypothetical protein